MIDEYVKIGMTAKMYLSVSVKGENNPDRQPCICVGKIEKILSEHEVEIEVLHQSEESFSKKETYVMYFIAPLRHGMCHVNCLASYHDEQKKILSFKILSPLEKVQRRMHEQDILSCRTDFSYSFRTYEGVERRSTGTIYGSI